jgi:hypothetical protein
VAPWKCFLFYYMEGARAGRGKNGRSAAQERLKKTAMWENGKTTKYVPSTVRRGTAF